MGGAASILFWCAAVHRPQAWSARCSGALVWTCLSAATPAGAGGWGAGARGVQVQPHSPPPASRSLLEEGGRPLASGGAEGRSCGSQLGGGAPPLPPPPRRASTCHLLSPACPPGVYSCRGGCRAATGVSRQRVSAAGGGGGGAPWFASPSSLGRPLRGLLCLRCPGRRRSAVGRQRAGRAGACLGRGAPAPWVQRPLRGGCGAAVSSVCLRPLMALRGRVGGGSGGGPLVPWRHPLTAEGGAAGRSRPWGPAIGWGVAPFPHPPLPRAGPSCKPSLGPLVPPAVVARRWPAGGGREG